MVLLGGEMKAKKYKQKHKFDLVEGSSGFYLYFWNDRKVAAIGTDPLGVYDGVNDSDEVSPEIGSEQYYQETVRMIDQNWDDYKKVLRLNK